VPQQIYFKAGTRLVIVADHRNTIYNQKIVLSVNGTNQTYYGLLGNSSSIVVVKTPNGSLKYHVNDQSGNYGTLPVDSPMIIVNDQEWEYGGKPAK
jgi:hypothetical protein